MEYCLSGKTVVVTGATSGIGLATAEKLAGLGAFVIGTGRSEARCQEARRRVLSTHPEAQVEYCVADFALQTQVLALAAEIKKKMISKGTAGLDGLINNAGTFAFWHTLTAEGVEMQWAVNHLAPFLLTHELLPLLLTAPAGRVVMVSSASHYRAKIHWEDVQLRGKYNGLRAYGQSKLANVLFTAEFNRRLGACSGVRAYAADPGLVQTDIGRKNTPSLAGWVWKWRSSVGITAEESARGVAYLISEPSIQQSGEIFWKHGAPKAPNPIAQDAEAARRLWEISEQMCGIQWDGLE